MTTLYHSGSNFEREVELIEGLSLIPENIALTPLRGNKAPYRENWQHEKPLSRPSIIQEIRSSEAKGYGVRTGEISGGIVAVDCDGEAAHQLAEEFGGLPETVQFTSGKNGRAQYLYQVDQKHWSEIQTRKYNTGAKGEDGKDILLELRWNGCQSVLPPSVHPETGRYQWVYSFTDKAIATAPDWIIEKMKTETPTKHQNIDSLQKLAPVPLYTCLSLDDRKLIDHGVSEGSRNDAGAKLARNLIGTAHRLQYLGYRVEDNPEDLFNDYCARCSPPIGNRERAAIWKSANKSNPTATLTDEMIENCIKAHRRNPSRTQTTNNYKVKGNNAVNRDQSQERHLERESFGLSKEEQIMRSRKIIQFPTLESQQTTEINELSKAANISAYEARKLVKEVEWEENLNADLIDSKKDFEKLITPVQLDLDEIFPAPLATALKTRAESDRVDPVRILQTVLPIIGTMLGGKVRVVLKPGETFKDDWEEYPIFYTVDIAPPSSGKSATQRGLIQPIQDLQRLELERVEKARIELAKVEEKWKSLKKDERAELADTTENPKVFEQTYCIARRYTFDQTTIQALGKKISQQPMWSGSCWLRDELYATFKSLDQFTKGKGEAEEFILSAWNGPLWGTVDRTDDANSYRFKGQCLNIAGGIQPQVAPKIWNTNNDPNGLLSRFLAAISQIPDDFEQWSTVKVNIYDTVNHYLKEIEGLPNTRLLLDDAAQSEFIKYWSLLRRGYKIYLEDNPAYSYFLGKQCSYVGRFALLIHVLNCVATGESIDSPVDITTIKKAIKLSQFYCHQFRLLQASSSVGDDASLENILYLVYQKAKSKGGTITTRDISNRDRKFQKLTYQGKKINAAVALQIFQAIAEAGLGRVEGKSLILGDTSKSKTQFLTQLTQDDTELCQSYNPHTVLDKSNNDTTDTVTHGSPFPEEVSPSVPIPMDDLKSKEKVFIEDPCVSVSPESKNPETYTRGGFKNDTPVSEPVSSVSKTDESYSTPSEEEQESKTPSLYDCSGFEVGDYVSVKTRNGNCGTIRKIEDGYLFVEFDNGTENSFYCDQVILMKRPY